MRRQLLLDTHVFLNLGLAPEELSSRAVTAIKNLDSLLFLSTASVWEIAIKAGRGKLKFDAGTEVFTDTVMRAVRIELLGIEPDHVLGVEHLPGHHCDPFDRLLVSQAQCEDLTIVTSDRNITKYEVGTLW